jgi:hypothetical protein
MTSIQKTNREMMTSARRREASGLAFDRAVELARIFLWSSLKYVMRPAAYGGSLFVARRSTASGA